MSSGFYHGFKLIISEMKNPELLEAAEVTHEKSGKSKLWANKAQKIHRERL